jgi:hypothetical protein
MVHSQQKYISKIPYILLILIPILSCIIIFLGLVLAFELGYGASDASQDQANLIYAYSFFACIIIVLLIGIFIKVNFLFLLIYVIEAIIPYVFYSWQVGITMDTFIHYCTVAFKSIL